ncbi:MAG: hypothetical protein GY720_22765 [bacterium]|nr:hypothetical protein [bacterium]
MIEPISGGFNSAATTDSNGIGQLGSDAFLKLLVAQLKYQNPLQPTDGAAMLQQTAQFTTVETLQSIAAMNQQLMGFQQVTMGLGLVGKHVDAIGLDGNPTQGNVESLRFTVDGPFLVLEDGQEIPMTNVISVTEATDGPAPEAPDPIPDPDPDPVDPPPEG